MKPFPTAVLMLLASVFSLAGAGAQTTQVSEVVIEGNKNVATDTIKAELLTREGEEFAVLRMNNDVVRIRRIGFFYEDSVSARHESTFAGERVIFTVEEHPQIAQIAFSGNTVVSSEVLGAAVSSKIGQVMNSRDVIEDARKLVQVYRNRGYLASIGVSDPEQMITRDGILTFPIVELVVEDIAITGNRKTATNVIRREIRTKPGDVLNVTRLQRDLERIYNLGLFEDVSLQPDEPFKVGSETDRVIPQLRVKEKKTGQISLGVGYSSPQGVVGRIELSEMNFRGRAEGINLLLEMGGRAGRTSYEVGFFEPYIDKHHTSVSLSVFNKVIYRFANSVVAGPIVSSDNDRFNEIRKGGQVTLTRPLSDSRRAVVGLRTEDIRFNLSKDDTNNPDLPEFVRQQGRISTINTRYIRDTRDILIDPAKGNYYTASVDVGMADIEPDVNGSYMKGSLDLRRYLSKGARKTPTEKKVVIAGRLLLGAMGGSVPFSEQFFVGGAETLRGHLESRFWGPNMFLMNLEYRRPVANTFQGVLFIDVGDAWGSDYTLPDTADAERRFIQHEQFSPKVGVGLGLRVTTPIGPLRLDWGFGSEGSRAHFSIGHVF